jgi:hypothetical protein
MADLVLVLLHGLERATFPYAPRGGERVQCFSEQPGGLDWTGGGVIAIATFPGPHLLDSSRPVFDHPCQLGAAVELPFLSRP